MHSDPDSKTTYGSIPSSAMTTATNDEQGQNHLTDNSSTVSTLRIDDESSQSAQNMELQQYPSQGVNGRSDGHSLFSSTITTNKKWLALGFGQCIAVLATTMNATSFTLTDKYHVDTQFFQMFLMYALLSVNMRWRAPPEHTIVRLQEDQNDDIDDQSEQQQQQNQEQQLPRHPQQHRIPFTSIHLKMPWWIYLIMSILDVLPNFMALISFHYTSLTSTTLLGSLTAPATMLFSKFILGRGFSWFHYSGVALCLLGGSITIWADVDESSMDGSNGASSHSYIGDLLAVTAALLYGFGDTVAEYFSKHVDRHEYIGMLGVVGAIITGLTFPWMESSSLVMIANMETGEKVEVIGIMILYVLSVLFYYMAEAKFLVTSDATLLNLSMQASNLWAIVFSVIVFHSPPPSAFYVALIFVIGGVFVYELLGGSSEGIVSPGSSGDAVASGDVEEEKEGCANVEQGQDRIQGQFEHRDLT